MYWIWDADEELTKRLFSTGVEDGGVIGSVLAPRHHPDPCEVSQVRVPALVVFPLLAGERAKARPEFRGYQGDAVTVRNFVLGS